MSNVLVRNLPDDVHDRLQQRARARGQSLQQYLTEELTRLAQTPTLEEVLARIATRTGGRVGLKRAAQDLADARTNR
ncbi:MAG: FitA-like ribbon-helix-helix domain-containing protein [Nocardioidaceae bacterium]